MSVTFSCKTFVFLFVGVAMLLIVSPKPLVLYGMCGYLYMLTLFVRGFKRSYSVLVWFFIVELCFWLSFESEIFSFVFSPLLWYQMHFHYPAFIALFLVISADPKHLCAALSSLKVPKKVLIAMLVALRFPKVLSGLVKKCLRSAKSRGLFSIRAFIHSPLRWIEYMLVPLSFALLRSADQLSVSAISRGSQASCTRSSYAEDVFGLADGAILLISTLVLGGLMLW